MKLCLINHSFRYELEKLIRIFLPFEKIEFFDDIRKGNNVAVTEIKDNKAIATLNLFGEATIREYQIEADLENFSKQAELMLATALFECFEQITGYKAQWGLLTGIRPAKLFSRLSVELGSQEKAERYFKEVFKVNEKKLTLCKSTRLGEEKIIARSVPNAFSLYISIPFCPTRCSYCSFVSHSVEKSKNLIPKYIEFLCEEIKITAKKARENQLQLLTVYIGGGTPTAISAVELEKIMQTVKENFDLSTVLEYTVEAGRPDTVTTEKLNVILKGGATRISINPQTMNNNVLEHIGRKHTAEQTIEAFKLARKVGFNNINMDLIAGLPSDTPESFNNTLSAILELNPENVTVHALSLKRSSTLTKIGELPSEETGVSASLMVDTARQRLEQAQIFPYYMYRQAKTVGNLENVGYSKKGYECLYNVYIMDETHTILACGASAVTKLRQPSGSYIERIFNFKYPYEYIDRFDQIIERKGGIDNFYAKFSIRN